MGGAKQDKHAKKKKKTLSINLKHCDFKEESKQNKSRRKEGGGVVEEIGTTSSER